MLAFPQTPAHSRTRLLSAYSRDPLGADGRSATPINSAFASLVPAAAVFN